MQVNWFIKFIFLLCREPILLLNIIPVNKNTYINPSSYWIMFHFPFQMKWLNQIQYWFQSISVIISFPFCYTSISICTLFGKHGKPYCITKADDLILQCLNAFVAFENNICFHYKWHHSIFLLFFLTLSLILVFTLMFFVFICIGKHVSKSTIYITKAFFQSVRGSVCCLSFCFF